MDPKCAFGVSARLVMLKVFQETLPKIKFRTFWSYPLKPEVTTGSLNLKSVNPFFRIEESSQHQRRALSGAIS